MAAMCTFFSLPTLPPHLLGKQERRLRPIVLAIQERQETGDRRAVRYFRVRPNRRPIGNVSLLPSMPFTN